MTAFGSSGETGTSVGSGSGAVGGPEEPESDLGPLGGVKDVLGAGFFCSGPAVNLRSA